MSQKPVFQKLLIRENYNVFLLNEPEDYRAKLGNLPQGVVISTSASHKPFNLIQFFATSKSDLLRHLPLLKSLLDKNGLIWVTYPKGIKEINRDVIRELAQTAGLQAVSLISVDEKWSALRLKMV